MKKILLSAFLVMCLVVPSAVSAERVGWLTDIHAGKKKKRQKSVANVLYPKKYKSYFSNVLAALRSAGISTVIITGDNTDNGGSKFAKALIKTSNKYGLRMVWVKGNHDKDKDKIMPRLGVWNTDYVTDAGDTKIVTLNNSQETVTSAQVDWLEEKLSSLDGPVIVAVHSPIINFLTGEPYPQFAELENVISTSGKVQYVLSGHIHAQYEQTYNGVVHRSGNPLTLKNHMGSYYIVETEEET